MCNKACCCEQNDCCCEPVMTDCLAKKIECIWKQSFCDATIIPVLGMPSCSNCVMTLTHSLGKCYPKIRLNGLKTLSSIVNNAFYSAEVSCCQWMNLYEITLPEIPGKNGCKSSSEVYFEALIKLGITVEGSAYGWKGICPTSLSIRSKAVGMDPCEFSNKQIAAIKAVLEYFSCCQ